jgi:hypothetical protein
VTLVETVSGMWEGKTKENGGRDEFNYIHCVMSQWTPSSTKKKFKKGKVIPKGRRLRVC